MVKYRYTALATVWLGLIVYLSFRKFSELALPSFRFQDKIGHLVMYALLSVLLFQALVHELRWTSPLTLAIFFSILIGMAIEFGQHNLTTYREGSLYDAIFNALGAVTLLFYHSKIPYK